MQTSTSIEELTRKKTKSTDDLVNDILKELQTVPSVTVNESREDELKEDDCDINTDSVTFHKLNKNENKNNSTNHFNIIINKVKIPLIIMTFCFVLNLSVLNRYISLNGPEWLNYYPNVLNILKSVLVAIIAFASEYFLD